MAFFFNNKRNHIRLLIKTDERKEGKKTLKPFSLFSFLSLILITLLSHFYTKAEKTNTRCSFYSSSVCCKVLDREKDKKKRRAIDFDCFAHHPEAAAKNPKLTKRRLFITHINISLSLSLSRLIDKA